MLSHRDTLLAKVKTLNETLWEDRARLPRVQQWLANFSGECLPAEEEQLHALFMLTQFMYLGDAQVRECLRALYRDLYRYPMVSQIRRANGHTLDLGLIEREFLQKLSATRFLGVGNPSESGCHLLYYFRQENGLAKELFINGYEVFSRDESTQKMELSSPNVSTYLFIDDFCGSGSQCVKYLRGTVKALKVLKPEATVCYFCLLGTSKGIRTIRENTDFDRVEAVSEIDSSYECFSLDSQVFLTAPDWFDTEAMRSTCEHYGAKLATGWPLGFGDGQLLLGFHHNVPDNTLPVIWAESKIPSWAPIFRRYHKKYKLT